ncbi:AraC family transcriptional regulator [Rhizobium lentis]|uniref:AraC family transcriptional regulator n=1 Tax=Rhizobium lentis TaxID=1138194 RepID=A0A9Q3MGI5_9HYPH|nr:AraC family transcriptional regulator [Rhizobium lentis]MBX5025464.1 AraC family transcriptional regulator [Rhizobium lentis]MBX5039112.1 AraC family transcriptional regulator [Rhizobium lentis]MBX5056453.1 AraC family transcriptional regulator [Rhizobium lentis]MBX5069966.1 AraC family transcriptional regulator [Rhizobium lentis]MBX5093899.1 AraC family transcriptional regulator [Rhizobium lentis]
MNSTLLECVRRFADANADMHGVARTPIPGLFAMRSTAPSEMQFAISKPLVALVLQGAKRVTMGSTTFDFGAGDSLLIAADVPNVSQITRASAGAPYYSLVLDIDLAVTQSLVLEIGIAQAETGVPIRVDPTEAEVADTALRLMRLLDRPASIPLLQSQLIREMHYWLLAGRHGAGIRALGITDSHASRIGRAVALIRSAYAETLAVEKLAEVAGMSPSSFHHHFRAVTSLSPLQFQKQLRLIEARRMMISEGSPISNAAYAVGYESVPQFTREYGRLFGASPARDVRDSFGKSQIAA